MRRVVLRDDESAAGLFVETMNNPRAFLSPNAGKIAAVGEQRVHERMLLMTRARMHDNSGRLVQDEEVVVFENDIERDLLRLGFDFLDLGFPHFHVVAGADEIARPGRFAIVGDELAANQRLQSGPGKRGKRLGQKTVEPLPGLFFGNDELDHG